MIIRALAFMASGLAIVLLLDHAGEARHPLLIQAQAVTNPHGEAVAAYRTAPCLTTGPIIVPPISNT